jgi:hypothetical protein
MSFSLKGLDNKAQGAALGTASSPNTIYPERVGQDSAGSLALSFPFREKEWGW